LGSAALETNENGQVISYEEYHPFGTSAYRVARSGTDLSLKRYRFTNKERDDETGLYYFGVRYYAAWLGRWTSSDPGGFVDGLNLYVYVRNNPVNGVDELGYETDPPPEEGYATDDTFKQDQELKIQPLPSEENKRKTKTEIENYTNLVYGDYPVSDGLLQNFGHDYVNYMWFSTHFRTDSSWEKTYQGRELIGAVGEVYAMNRSAEGFGNIFNEDKQYINADFSLNSPSSANDGTWDYRGTFTTLGNLFYFRNQYLNLKDRIDEKRVEDFTMFFHDATGTPNVAMDMEFSESTTFDVVYEVKTWNAFAYSGSLLRKSLKNAIDQTNRHIDDTGADFGVLVLPTELWNKAIEEGVADELYGELNENARLMLLPHLRTDSIYAIEQLRRSLYFKTTNEQGPQPDNISPPPLPKGVGRG
jgi:RHS repeat-associated protein